MKCPKCGVEIVSLPCRRCEQAALDTEVKFKSLSEEFSLVQGAPETNEEQASLERAVACIRKRLKMEQFRGSDVTFDPQNLLRSKTWWYIPFTWIGCAGFIVNMDDGYVNWLGSSATGRLHHWFWGHERGLYNDLLDFEFARDTNRDLVARLLSQFHHMFPNARGVLPNSPVWYRDSEIPAAIEKQFPLFKRHNVWPAIPQLMEACAKEGLRFTSRLAQS